MKTSLVLLVISLLTNVGLLMKFFSASPPSQTPAETANILPAQKTAAGGPVAQSASSTLAGAGLPARTGIWAQLYTEDLAELVKRLKAAGFSPVAIADIVREQINDRLEPRRRAIVGDVNDVPYWKSPNQAYRDPKKAAKLAELEEERAALMAAVFGPQRWLEVSYEKLPPQKTEAIVSINADYRELTAKLSREIRERGGPATPEDLKKFEALNQEQRADIARLLTPEELFEHDVRSSAEASLLLTDTKAFQPSEGEFRALFPFYRAALENVRTQASASPAEAEALWRAAEQEMQSKIKGLLGPERYADYLQSKDPASEKLNRIVQRLELPLSAATAVVAVEKDVTQRADAVKADRSLTAEQRQVQLSALAGEATTRITATLGARGFGAYQQYSGKWLQTLQPKPAGRKP